VGEGVRLVVRAARNSASHRTLADRPANVVIVDISDLQPVDGITPRASLEELVVALRKAGAEAVTIDIDFSPDHNMFVGQNDPDVFER